LLDTLRKELTMKSKTLALVTAMTLSAVFAMVCAAQTVTVLVKFDGIANPQGGWNSGNASLTSLVQGKDGNLWGTTQAGGAPSSGFGCGPGSGTIFKITPIGTLSTRHIFHQCDTSTDGQSPQSGVALGVDGNFYGTTQQGGLNFGSSAHDGTVFKITSGGAFTTLFSFPNDFNNPPSTDGSQPVATLVQGTDGNFYGTTTRGGQNTCGTVFKITAAGAITPLFSLPKVPFCDEPFGTMIQATDGNFYGTTRGGGAHGFGMVYKIIPTTPAKFVVFYSFKGSCGASCTSGPFDGQTPNAGLIQGSDGNFYGTTESGGKNSSGTVFKITPAGAETVLHSFGGTAFTGFFLDAPLIQATDGNLYGTTVRGGNTTCFNGCGTIFRISPAGTLVLLHKFMGSDGAAPTGGLVQFTDGSFYGMTSAGGNQHTGCNSSGCGTIFHVVVPGLRPFVKTVPTSGKVGTMVSILGNNLTGATSVKFNGVVAKFVTSSTDIAATVPVGATSGTVTVVTPTRTLSSNVKFRVTLQ
jgi:uncharacterized repeat protein (TIGR03803 family)